MRQVLNWVGGGFFRTIGRTLAFLALGALAYYLFSKSSFDIKDLFFEKVNASTIVSAQQPYYYSNAGTDRLTYYQSYDQYYIYSIGNGLVQYFTFQSGAYSSANEGIPVPNGAYKMNIRGYLDYDSYYKAFECWEWDNNNTCESWDTDNVGLSIQVGSIGPVASCTINSFGTGVGNGNEIYFTASCPIGSSVQYVNYIRYNLTRNTNNNRIGMGIYVENFEVNDSQAIIDNQNQNTQAIIEQQQNSTQQIMDTNSTETDETATSFFDDFQDNDHGGLSSIITAPLVVINEMLNGVCVQPTATWKGATISLPCGDLLWSRNGASDLKNLLNIFYGGVICYYAIRKLFIMIEGLKDPTQDRIEVTDL